jgi:hypothetical protein
VDNDDDDDMDEDQDDDDDDSDFDDDDVPLIKKAAAKKGKADTKSTKPSKQRKLLILFSQYVFEFTCAVV